MDRPNARRRNARTAAVVAAGLAAGIQGWTEAADGPACRVVRAGDRVELQSPFFVYRLAAGNGLRAESWTNRRTGRTVTLGGGPEVALDIGLPVGPLRTPTLQTVSVPPAAAGSSLEAVFELASDDPAATLTVTYRWDSREPVLRKLVTIANRSGAVWNRLLNVRLGDYPLGDGAVAPMGTERGFPAYVGDDRFLCLAHPAGLADVTGGTTALRQFPGATVAPGAAFACMEAVYGVGELGGARRAFLDHLTGRLRRTVRGHDRPYAIFEPFGARPDGNFDETEEFVLDSIAKVAAGQRQTGLRFDAYSVDFWVDYRGTLKECDPGRFPNGLSRILPALQALGVAPGLWIDSSWELWSIGGNPAVQSCLNTDPSRPDSVREVPGGRRSFCRATEPVRSLYVEAFRHHIGRNGVRVLKFDNLATVCVNPAHAHLPGLWSTEPITDAVIEFLHALDQECPDVFLMLYWGYRSPWWLLHADTLFDSGIGIEAASPSTRPAPHARDSISHKLDQAQWYASDVPALGKDSLGVWLSNWGWNSQVGKERWQEGFILDLCRGSLLAQPWSDTDWLSAPERQQMAEFVALLRARPACFRSPRGIVGDPWKDEPYGYACSDGTRAFVALHNYAWQDNAITLRLNPDWGLPPGGAWDLYRWYPEPARLQPSGDAFSETAAVWLRPFDVALLEIVPAGQAPTLDRAFPVRPMPVGFDVASRELPVRAVYDDEPEPAPGTAAAWATLTPSRALSAGGAALAPQADGSVLASGSTPSPDTYTVTADTQVTGITALRLEALPHASLPGGGPGRAVNGNFALTGIRVRVAPRGRPGEAVSVPLRQPQADFAQESHGGWPVAAALDADPRTGWSIDPEEGRAHEAVFETVSPVGFPDGTTVVVELDQGEREHELGCFRLSVTADAPVPAPRPYTPRRLQISGHLPPLPAAGLVVVTVEMSLNGKPYEIRDVGRYLQAEGSVDGQPAAWQPVLGTATYPSAWQAWRLPLAPATAARDIRLAVLPRTATGVALRCTGHIVIQ